MPTYKLSDGSTVIAATGTPSDRAYSQREDAELVAGDRAEDGSVEVVLHGRALDDALRSAGLPIFGKVADKQARLAEHLAGTASADATADHEQPVE